MSAKITPLSENNFSLIADWLMDPNINRWLYTEWRDRKIDDRLIAITSRGGKNHMWLASFEGAPYGLVAVGNICSKDRSGVMWYLRGSGVKRRSGVMTQCVREVALEAFQILELHSISASTQTGNDGSERLLKSVGFTQVGTFREAFFVEGQFVDRNLFDLLKSDLEITTPLLAS